MAASHCPSSVTSRRMKVASPPPFFISVILLCPSSSKRSQITTLAPSVANNLAVAAPIPNAPPVTKATFPSNRPI